MMLILFSGLWCKCIVFYSNTHLSENEHNKLPPLRIAFSRHAHLPASSFVGHAISRLNLLYLYQFFCHTFACIMVTYTTTKRAQIVDFHKAGMDFKQIDQKLGLHHSVVSRNYQKMLRGLDQYAKVSGRGCPKIMMQRQVCHAVHTCTSGSAVDATNVKLKIFSDLSVQPVQIHLKDAGLIGRVHHTVPYLKPHHWQQWLEWAKGWVYWTVEDWVWFRWV